MAVKQYQTRRGQRHARVRGKIFGTSKRPRLSVFRSAKHVYAQLINDENAKTLAAASDLSIKKGTKLEKAKQVGERLAQEARKKKIKSAAFDRGGYKYHGRVRAVAEGAREGGLEF
jgi:large subunit ribosomal protein L18